jgi:hypothetical protein
MEALPRFRAILLHIAEAQTSGDEARFMTHANARSWHPDGLELPQAAVSLASGVKRRFKASRPTAGCFLRGTGTVGSLTEPAEIQRHCWIFSP